MNVVADGFARSGGALARSVRALFPPVDRRRLRFRGGLVALPLYLVMILVYPASLQQADWVDTTSHFAWIAIFALLFGTLAGNGRVSVRRAGPLGAALGAAVVLLLTIQAGVAGTSFHERAVATAMHVNNYLTQVLAGEAASDPTVFILFLGATVWAATYVGSFALARERRIWDAIILCGFCLVVNVSLALTSLLFDLVVFSLCVLLLLLRLHMVTLQERWDRNNIQPTGEMDWRLARGGLTWTAVLVIMALVTPRVGAAELVNGAFGTFEGPYHRVEAEWQRFFAGVSGPSRLRGVSFSDSIRLGQAPNLGDRVVMTVDAPGGHFWRAVTYDFYTGAGWRTTETDKADKINPTYSEREKLEVTFDVVVPHANLLFAPNEPTKVSVPFQFQTGEDRNYSTSLHAVNRGQAEGPYIVTALTSTADKVTLRKATTVYPAYIRSKYLQLPSSLPQRVKDKAHQIADDKANPYDKAEAIETYLRQTYRYNTVVKSAPPGRDPVDYFLFDLKEDFCEYFASSMTVMLRELGVPARMVEGFTTGTFDPEQGRYVVRELNAHAWVEVYVPQYGWIEFEPTPSETVFPRIEDRSLTSDGDSGIGGVNRERDPDRDQGDDQIDRGSGREGPDDEGFAGGALNIVRSIDPRPALAALLLLLLGLVGAFARFELRFRGRPPIESAWGKTRLLGSYVGHSPTPSQTAYEYAESLAGVVPDARAPLRDIAHARVMDIYSRTGASDAELDAVESAWGRVARALLALIPQRVLRALTRFVR